MKTMKYWSLMIMLLALPLISACGSDDEENDNSIPFTTEILVDKNCFWDIKEITGSHSGFYKGASAESFPTELAMDFTYISDELSFEVL